MSYASVDALQNILSEKVFSYTANRKKAAGRALGTLVEIITYYTLCSWGIRDSIAIERSLPEYNNSEITHSVEYSLHPVIKQKQLIVNGGKLPLSARKIREIFNRDISESSIVNRTNPLLSSDKILRNSCVVAESNTGLYVCHLTSWSQTESKIKLSLIYKNPYAIFECKKVGIETGNKKGPQTIEKAKQGAYVARTISSLQKVRLEDGRLGGFISPPSRNMICKPYEQLLEEIIESEDPHLLSQFVLTAGIVSNHGNWFTSENPNKELHVLAQSYDWLLFLTDDGLTSFIRKFLLEPVSELVPVREAFLASYSQDKKKNRFTKVQMDFETNTILLNYFVSHKREVASWFNVITPKRGSLTELFEKLAILSKKNWKKIHQL